MTRLRTNDPFGVSDKPATVGDPVREAELSAEFVSRLDYVSKSYLAGRQALGDPLEFNRSLATLRRAMSGRGSLGAIRKERLHPELEMLISERARRVAAKRTGAADATVIESDVEAAVLEVLATTKPRRARPADRFLRHHVEGLMALIQEFSGKPVRAQRTKNSCYEPHFPDAISSIIPLFFEAIDHPITVTALANIVNEARKKYAGRPMRFRDFFPGYGATIDAKTGLPVLARGLRLEHFEPSIPIYCS